MADSYIEFHFSASEEEQEALIGHLSTFNFDSFWQQEDQLIAYLKKDNYSTEFLSALQEQFGAGTFQVNEMQQQNWNAIWESKFDPVVIGDFCYVKAEFHEDHETAKHTIVIRPKMAFGTAHHETTFMMIQMMEDIDCIDKKIVDFGCGTGILSVLASKLSAAKVIAFDHEEPSVENTKEHIQLNGSKNVLVYKGGIDFMAKQSNVDLVLANINRSVLMASKNAIFDSLKPGGLLLMSGVLIEDLGLILSQYFPPQFKLLKKQEKGEWSCLLFEKEK